MNDEKHSPGPWRVGGQAYLPDGAETFQELSTGMDIWAANGEPVTELGDHYNDADLVLIASAPTLAAELAEAVELLRRLANKYGANCADATDFPSPGCLECAALDFLARHPPKET